MHIDLSDNNFTQLIVFLIGIVFLITGYVNSKRNSKLYKKGRRTEGVIFALERNDGFKLSGYKESISWYVTVRYVTADNLWITKRFEENSSPLSFAEGDKVKVIYDPSEPEQSILDNASSKYSSAIFMVIGILLIAGSTLAYYFDFKLKS